MYYNHAPTSPGRSLPLQHDPSAPWSRTHHPVLGPAPQQAQQGAGPPPPSPGYGLVRYTNGTAMHHHPMAHSYTSPTPTHQQANIRQPSSPGPSSQLMGSTHWQQQMIKAEVSRQSSSPHHRARASALASRNTTKSAIPIMDANGVVVSVRPNNATESNEKKDENSSVKSEGSAEESQPNSANGHPSSTAAPVSNVSAPRPSAPSRPTSSWATLDMGGMRLKNLSPAVFNYQYLTTLYINHNQISTLSPEISRLRHLVLLDMSGNQLTSLPPELGMCTSLRELYFFDNHLETLPLELGSLHQLEMLGVEGNPLQAKLRAIIQKDGTPALIAYLRDTCLPPQPPPERAWRFLQTQADRDLQDADPSVETFSLLCYNILCEKYATTTMYGYTPSWALGWEYRKENILTEILNYEADFICLQEVDVAQYEDYFSARLGEHGYEGVYWPKSRARTMGDSERRRVDGCATFFKSTKYQLVEKQLIEFNQLALQRPDLKKTEDMFNRVITKDNIAVVTLLENRQTGSRLIVTNVHIHWDPEYRDVKLLQVALLADELPKIAERFAKFPPRLQQEGQPPPPSYSEPSKIPMIVCGDFNSVPESGVYDFLSTGSVPANHADFMDHIYGDYTSKGLNHKLGLKSAYATVGELPITNYTPSFEGVIDYIWYSAESIAVNAVLGEVDQAYLSKIVGFPNAHFPSDHVCIIAEFRLRPVEGKPTRKAVTMNGVHHGHSNRSR